MSARSVLDGLDTFVASRRMPEERAERLVADWEADAERRALVRGSVEFWRQGHEWLARRE